MKLVDLKVACTGTDFDGKDINGTVTARIDVSRQPWPDQQWDGWMQGQYPLLVGSPIRVKEVISAEVIEQ